MRAPTLPLLLFLSAGAVGAAETAPAPDADGLAFFESRIRPVLVEKCYGCHSAEAKKLKGELYLDTRAGVLKGGETGPALIPGDPDKSLLIKAIGYTDPDLQMPPKERLAPAVVADLVAWVKRGAPDSRNGAAGVAPAKKGIDLDAARKHWAYGPLAAPKPPTVKDAAWAHSPIDAFILAKLEAAKAKPAAPAPRPVLIRRLCLDLTGLPPTPEEVDAFVADRSADAVEKLVDRLLASTAFGERWARHWLDLARFAESHGYEQDYDRPFAYHYRDFVIQALNRDLPYDTFVSWQLAGDELAPDDNLALAATGFIAAGVWPTQITKNEVEKARYDALDDMLSTTFTAMLGTTVGCARCHDHKYDPIAQRDYYRLLSTFTTTIRSDVERDVTDEGFTARKAAFDAAHEPFEAAVRRYEADELPRHLAAAEGSLDPAKSRWTVPTVEKSISAGGATIKPQDDGSLLLSGKNPDHETLTITVTTDLVELTGLRIEALAHPSLVKGGPGRAGNGNFALTDLTVKAAPLAGGPEVAVALKDPRADFEQKGLPVAAAIDGDGTSGWAIDPQFGKNHAAAFSFASPVGFPGGSRLTIVMKFNNNLGHGIGRPRLSLTTAPGAVDPAGDGVQPAVAAALKAPAAQRTDAQRAALIAWYGPQDPEWRRLRAAADAHRAQEPKRSIVKMLIGTEGLAAVRLHTQGDDFFTQTFWLKRGDPALKIEPAMQSFLPVLMGSDEKHWIEAPPTGWRTSYRRKALAKWLVDTEQGAGRLLARVEVNRLWQHLLGKGIVTTPSDFGLHGDPPSHPELLDWLASELVRGGWRVKPIIRAIALSSTYQESAVADSAAVTADPQNALLSRFRRHRLEAEAIRDSLLSVGGLLDRTMYGPGTLDVSNHRRSIYFTIKRSALIPFLSVFDFPEPLQGVAERPATVIAPQALALLNNPQARIWAAGLAARVAGAGSAEAAVDAAYRIALGRLPTKDERADGLGFIAQQTIAHKDAPTDQARTQALTDFCQVVMCLNEAIYVE